MEIKIGDNILVLENEIKMKHLKVLYPLFRDLEKGESNEVLILENVINTLFISLNGENDISKLKDFIDNLLFEDIEQLSNDIGKLIEKIQSKKNKGYFIGI